MSEALRQAEHTADQIRGELLRTLGELERRREAAADVRTQVRTNWKLLAALGAVAGGMLAARVMLGQRAARKQAEALARERRQSLLRAWRHPERIAPARHSAPVELGTKLATIVGTAVATQLARRLAQRIAG